MTKIQAEVLRSAAWNMNRIISTIMPPQEQHETVLTYDEMRMSVSDLMTTLARVSIACGKIIDKLRAEELIAEEGLQNDKG